MLTPACGKCRRARALGTAVGSCGAQVAAARQSHFTGPRFVLLPEGLTRGLGLKVLGAMERSDLAEPELWEDDWAWRVRTGRDGRGREEGADGPGREEGADGIEEWAGANGRVSWEAVQRSSEMTVLAEKRIGGLLLF